MCLIERLPAKIIDFPIAWTGGKYIGGMPASEPLSVKQPRRRAKPGKKGAAPIVHTAYCERPVARQMHAQIFPFRMSGHDDKRYRTHSHKRVLLKHRRLSIRVLAALQQ